MIRRRQNGTYYCDGRECGYPLSYLPPDPDEPGSCALVSCPDCWASMNIAPPKPGEVGS